MRRTHGGFYFYLLPPRPLQNCKMYGKLQMLCIYECEHDDTVYEINHIVYIDMENYYHIKVEHTQAYLTLVF